MVAMKSLKRGQTDLINSAAFDSAATAVAQQFGRHGIVMLHNTQYILLVLKRRTFLSSNVLEFLQH